MDVSNKNIAISGASGFIGSRLLSLFSNDEVRLLVRSPRDDLDYQQIGCDLESADMPSDCFSGIDTVFHLAGFAHDVHNQGVQESYHKVNVVATVQLAKLAAKSGVKRFVFVSSVKAGGAPMHGECADESNQHCPDGIYGETKRSAEKELLKISLDTGMAVSIIRPALVYGPQVKGNLKLMMSGIDKGFFPPLPKVKNKRSMIHVDDLVRAILFIAEDDRAKGEIFIATDGRSYSSREIYTFMCSALEKKVPSWYMPKFLFNIASLISPRINYKINKLLGDECYSSAKLEALGFQAKKSLRDINETDF